MGTVSCAISRRLRAIASDCPRSSAPMPAQAPGVSMKVSTGTWNFSASFIRRSAWAGIGAEERGQSEAIARNLIEMAQLTVPIVATVIGEGGSGGALALGVADRILMLEHSVYSVITVEGCAAILWKDGKSPEMREKAASSLRITSEDLVRLGIVDEVIPEPPGGAHADHAATAAALHDAILAHVDELRRLKPDKLVRKRREKFLKMGAFTE